ncbi:MAG: flavin reductase family protein [Gemmatimonadota bacterium]|nr:flavin reductase family protein [Gemmatimonadota bacterium]
MSQFPDAVDAARFRDAMSRLATGVSIVTTADADGAPFGLTATAVCSVSLEPPIVLASLAASSATHAAIRVTERFALNFLGRRNADLARRFSSSATDKFVGVDWRPGVTGCPVLPAALAVCECELERTVQVGDHSVYFGQVLRVGVDDDSDDPLVYFRGSYEGLARSSPS